MSCNCDSGFIAGSPKDVAARIVNAPSGTKVLIVPGDVDHIDFTVTIPDATTITGTITPSSGAIFATPRTGDKYDQFSEWNFEYTMPATWFPVAAIGKEVKVKFEFENAVGQPVVGPLCLTGEVMECGEC